MKKQTSNKSSGWKFFLAGFLLIIVLMVNSALRSKRGRVLEVRDNKGMAQMATAGDLLAAVFQDGQTVVWDWNDLAKLPRQFRVPSDRVVFLAGGRMGVIAKVASTFFSVYELATGQKQKDIRIGSAADEVWPAVSPDGQTILIVRKVAAGKGRCDYEFMTLHLVEELPGIPVVVSIVDFAVTDDGTVLAAGSKDGTGRLLAIDLDRGSVSWDRTYDDTKEFCSLVLSPDHTALYAGNRNGLLYKIGTEAGDMQKQITLLREGETRPITNDLSVLYLKMDAEGRYLSAVISPQLYILDVQKGEIFFRGHPGHKLVSWVAFSPNSKQFASSDIRANGSIKIWELEKLK
jgi:WD40 repeat protein